MSVRLLMIGLIGAVMRIRGKDVGWVDVREMDGE
jgi:hypothetical protein